MKVIVADDSQVMRMIIAKIVRALGYEPLHAGNGEEVLSILEKGDDEIELILLDWNMPVLNGLEVLNRMRGKNPRFDIPVLMVSTESEEEKVRQALDAGASGYIGKPFTQESLAVEVTKLRNRRGLK